MQRHEVPAWLSEAGVIPKSRARSTRAPAATTAQAEAAQIHIVEIGNRCFATKPRDTFAAPAEPQGLRSAHAGIGFRWSRSGRRRNQYAYFPSSEQLPEACARSQPSRGDSEPRLMFRGKERQVP